MTDINPPIGSNRLTSEIVTSNTRFKLHRHVLTRVPLVYGVGFRNGALGVSIEAITYMHPNCSKPTKTKLTQGYYQRQSSKLAKEDTHLGETIPPRHRKLMCNPLTKSQGLPRWTGDRQSALCALISVPLQALPWFNRK